MATIKKRVTEYEYTLVSFIEFGKPIFEMKVSYEPLKLRDLYREFAERHLMKPQITCKTSIILCEVDTADFVKLAKESKNKLS